MLDEIANIQKMWIYFFFHFQINYCHPILIFLFIPNNKCDVGRESRYVYSVLPVAAAAHTQWGIERRVGCAVGTSLAHGTVWNTQVYLLKRSLVGRRGGAEISHIFCLFFFPFVSGITLNIQLKRRWKQWVERRHCSLPSGAPLSPLFMSHTKWILQQSSN